MSGVCCTRGVVVSGPPQSKGDEKKDVEFIRREGAEGGKGGTEGGREGGRKGREGGRYKGRKRGRERQRDEGNGNR